MDDFQVSYWVIFSLLGATGTFLILSLLYFLLTRCYYRRRVDPTHGGPAVRDPFAVEKSGVDQSVMETLFPKFTYTAAQGKEMCRGMLVCVICLEVFKENETLRSVPACRHVFHSHCVEAWLKTHDTCPCCRARVVSQPAGSGLLKMLRLNDLVRLV